MSLQDDPLGGAARKKLHFFFIADCSGSMSGEKIQVVNRTIHELTPTIRQSNDDNPFAQMVIRAISFATGAQWHIAAETPIAQFSWADLRAGGVTDLGAAIDLLSEALTPERMGRRNLPPVIVLLSDGGPTDAWEPALKRFNQTPWGRAGRTTRVAIAIGRDADTDVLQRFTGNPETVFEAQNAATLSALIKWATVTLSTYASKSGSVVGGGNEPPPLPPLPPVVMSAADDDDDTW